MSSSSAGESLSESTLNRRSGNFLATEEANSYSTGSVNGSACFDVEIIPLYLLRVLGVQIHIHEWESILETAQVEFSKRKRTAVDLDTGGTILGKRRSITWSTTEDSAATLPDSSYSQGQAGSTCSQGQADSASVAGSAASSQRLQELELKLLEVQAAFCLQLVLLFPQAPSL